MNGTSVGAIALDLILGKETFSSSIKNSIQECAKEFTDTGAILGTKVDAIGNCVKGIGSAILPTSAAIGGLGLAIGNMSMDFEDAMAKVNTIADTTQVPLDELEKQILDLSSQTGISASEIADNVYNAISAGQKTGDAVNFVSNATKLAKAGFTDSASSLDILSTVMNAYGLEAEKVNNVSDMLIQTQNKGKTTVAELSANMGRVIPTAQSMGVGLDNLCSAYSIMTAKGISTAESTTYINSMLNELGKSSTTVGKVLKEQTGMSFQECMNSGMTLGDVLGQLKDYADKSGTSFNELWSSSEAGKAGLSLLSDGVDSFNSRLGEMQNSAGMTDEAFKKMDTNSYSLQRTLNNVKNVGTELGGVLMETLGPIIDTVCAKVSAFTKWFSGLDDGVKKVIVGVGLFVACLGPALIGIGSVISIVGKCITAFNTIRTVVSAAGAVIGGLSAPILITVGVIAGLIAIGVLLYKNWDKIKETAINVFNGVKNTIGNIASVVVSGFTNAINWIKSLPSQAWNWGADIISNIANGIKGAIGKVTNAVKGVADKIRSFLHFSEPDVGPLSDFHTYMPDMMDLMSEGIEGNTSNLMKTVNGLASEMSNALCIEAEPQIKAANAGPRTITNNKSKLEELIEKLIKWLDDHNIPTDSNGDDFGDLVIPVYIGNDTIDEIIVTAQQRRNARSGGMS